MAGGLLLLGKGAVSARRIERPFAAELDDQEEPQWERRARLLGQANASVSVDQIDAPERRGMKIVLGELLSGADRTVG